MDNYFFFLSKTFAFYFIDGRYETLFTKRGVTLSTCFINNDATDHTSPFIDFSENTYQASGNGQSKLKFGNDV